jgi:hypothetical protein
MIKLKDLLLEAKWDKVAHRVWDHIISKRIYLTQEKLEELSNAFAIKCHYNKKDFYEAVKRIAKSKNWFTQFIVDKGQNGAGVF